MILSAIEASSFKEKPGWVFHKIKKKYDQKSENVMPFQWSL